MAVADGISQTQNLQDQWPAVQHPSTRGFQDLTGHRFERLIAMHYVGQRDGLSAWLLQCDCGNQKISTTKMLRACRTPSCGCLRTERMRAAKTRHGYKGTRTYRIWGHIWNRCTNAASRDFKRYGGRGIRVDDRWSEFSAFLVDMGECPPGLTIERKNNSGPYCKANCVWATPKQQARNRRSNQVLSFDGEIMTASEWNERRGFARGTVSRRIRDGWSVREAIETPINQNFSRPQKSF